MSSSKSLPSNFKQKLSHNSSTITISFVRDKSIIENSDIINNPSSLSSSVKKSSPLTKSSWCNEDIINNSSTISSKSWITRRWSTVSASVIVRQRYKKTTASQLWLNRQKRRTYPPCIDIPRQDQKRFPVFKRKIHRQSLADILTAFYSGSSDSSSVSKKIEKMLKKKGKQPYHKKLWINTQRKPEEAARVFQHPPTMSSNSSSPSTQIKFPTPPKRFSAIFIDAYGRQGKVDYVRPKKGRPQYLLNLIQYGVPHKLPMMYTKNTTPAAKNYIDEPSYGLNKQNPQLTMYATLFLFGFICFPCWWIGAWLHYRQKKPSCSNNFDLFSVQTFSYLNVMFAVISMALLIIIIAFVIWLAKS